MTGHKESISNFKPVSEDLEAGISFTFQHDDNESFGLFSYGIRTRKEISIFGRGLIGIYCLYRLKDNKLCQLGLNMPGVWATPGYKLYSLEDRVVVFDIDKPLEEYGESIQLVIKLFEESKYLNNFKEFCKAIQLPKEEVLTKLIGKMEGWK